MVSAVRSEMMLTIKLKLVFSSVYECVREKEGEREGCCVVLLLPSSPPLGSEEEG